MTFAALANKFRVHVDAPVDKIGLLRDAENDFIEQTWCVQSYTATSVSGTTNLITPPSGFIKIWRLTWDGDVLEPIPQGTRIPIYDQSGNAYTGTPTNWWLQNEQILLYPQPTCTGTLGIWSTNYNTDTSSASPTIPTIEQNKLLNHAMATLLEMDGEETRASIYWAKYREDVINTKIKYLNQRFASGQDIFEGEGGQYIGTSSVTNEYVWKKVEFTGTTEQVFITGTSPLALGELDSGQVILPTFTTPVKVEITASYQDRDAYISTDPTISGGCVTFGVTRSALGSTGTCYYDISITQLSS